MILRTERLVVRRFTDDDVDAFHAYRDDPRVAQFQGWSVPFPRERAEHLVHEFAHDDMWRNGAWTQVALARHDDPDGLIGDLGIRLEPEEPTAELGMTIAPAHQGNGYAAEALRAMSEFLFERLGMARVVAFTHKDHIAGQLTLEAAGLRYVTLDGDDFVYYRRAE